MPRPPEYPIRPHPKGGAADPGLVLPGGTAASKDPGPSESVDAQIVVQQNERQALNQLRVDTLRRHEALKAARAFHQAHHDVKAVGEICAAIRRTFAREGEQL